MDDGEIRRHAVTGPSGRRLRVLERSITFPDGTAAHRIAVAADEGEVANATGAFDRVLWLSLGVLGTVLIVAAVVQVDVGLRPLSRLGASRPRSAPAAAAVWSGGAG